MTEKRQLPEQMASHIYRRPASVEVAAHPARQASQVSPARPAARMPLRKPGAAAKSDTQRIVTVPEADPSSAWNTFAQRQEQRRRARSRPIYENMVPVAPRTYAQTGVRATSGRLRAIRRLPTYRGSPVPVRSSGQRRGKRGFLWKLLSLFVGTIALIFVINMVMSSNAFRVEQVNVAGTRNDALIQTIQGMGMRGQNIFLMDVTTLKKHIEVSPLVASVDLSKQWPNQITVDVVERTPVLLWQTAQGTYSVDDQGFVIAPASQTQGADHLRTVIDPGSPAKGVRVSGSVGSVQLIHPGVHLNQADVMFAIGILAGLPQIAGVNNFTLRYNGTIYADTNQQPGRSSGGGSYIVESPDGWVAYLGSAGDANPLSNRLIELQQILSITQQPNLATVDLRYGLRPVYTLKQ